MNHKQPLTNFLRLVKRCNSFFLFFFFLTPFISYSQTNQQNIPVFVLQGTVILKGKPVDGVSLELTKDEKQIAKIITMKNGMYSFQMNKSNTVKETEYLLNIVKEGTIPGVLRINTFTAKEEFDNVPYIFNLDINLILPTVPDVAVKHDFGKIKLDSDRGIFDFDKEYAQTIGKDKNVLKTDSSKALVEATEKLKKEEEEIKGKPDEKAKQNEDTLALQSLAVKESIKPASELKEPTQIDGDTHSNEKKEAIAVKNKLATDTVKSRELSAKTEPKAEGTNLKPRLSNSADLALNKANSPLEKPTKPSSIVKPNTITPNVKPASNVLEKKTELLAKLKTNENSAKLSDLKEKEETKKVSGSRFQVAEKEAIQTTTKLETSNLIIEKNFFDGAAVFSLNNEKSKLIEIKEKMERKKGENLAKKYETNNILTSLLDVVEEYDKK